MTVIEGYCADLYCDCADCRSGKNYPKAEADFMGRNMTDTLRQARDAGWRISRDRTRAFAPGHKITREAV